MAKPTVGQAAGCGAAADGETCTLVLQGGGALGAYQAGVYEAMAEAGLEPAWVAGTSIGAINAAIIAGNPPERRVERLREFWELVTSRLRFLSMDREFGNDAREWVNESRAALVSTFGVEGFFTPRLPAEWLQWPGTRSALSFYDTSPLAKTLERLIDFDLINHHNPRHRVRLSVDAVDVASGNMCHFDSAHPEAGGPIGPRHIMASGALPPGFPPIEINGRHYWDGGLVSNTPLHYVLHQPCGHDTLIVQVDLFSARGALPQNLNEVAERMKDIRYSSRTRANSDRVAHLQQLGAAARRLAAKLPPELREDPDLAELLRLGTPAAVTIMHLIYRSAHYESQSKDYEFSRQSVRERWRKGLEDMRASLAHPRCQDRSHAPGSLTVLDLASAGAR